MILMTIQTTYLVLSVKHCMNFGNQLCVKVYSSENDFSQILKFQKPSFLVTN